MAARHPVPKPLRGWLLPLAVLALWWWARASGWSDSKLLVSPAEVAERGAELIASGQLWTALSASLGRNLIGFAIGAAAGLAVGALLGLSRRAERLIGPSLHTLKQISLFAWIPLLSVWFGLGETAKIAFLAIAAFFPVLLNSFEGIRSVPGELVELARVLRYSRWQLLRRVVLPASAPSIFAGIHLGLIYAWLATLGAEYLLASGPGMGGLLVAGREHFEMDLVLVGVGVVGLVGYGLNSGAGWLEARALAWRGRSVANY
ncbi:ABC transporter permease [Roseateles cavernae]|uniref:ABC transporter permease n=1 Tax=Roseateles cavernae TaxID=3153578 RepID=UPI0032E524D2